MLSTLTDYSLHSDIPNRTHEPGGKYATSADKRIAASLNRLHYKNERLIQPDANHLFSFDASYLDNGLIAA